jgi:hypothetical protein
MLGAFQTPAPDGNSNGNISESRAQGCHKSCRKMKLKYVINHVRFTPISGHRRLDSQSPLLTHSGHWRQCISWPFSRHPQLIRIKVRQLTRV